MKFPQILAIAKRELKSLVLTKAFLIMTLMFPLIFVAMGGIQAVFMTYEDDDVEHLVFVDATGELQDQLMAELATRSWVESGKVKCQWIDGRSLDNAEYVKERSDDLFDESLTGIVFLPEDIEQTKKAEYHSLVPGNMTMIRRIESAVNAVLVDRYFSSLNISEEQLSYARSDVDVAPLKVDETGNSEEESILGPMILAFVLTMLLYLGLLVNGATLMRAVTEEKNNRIVELLLSSVAPQELMAGKILGAAGAAILQMLIWLSPMMALAALGGGASEDLPLPLDVDLSIPVSMVAYFLLNFVIGMLTYLAMFAAVGSLFDNEQDAQQGMWPVMLLIMIPFFIAYSMGADPGNSLAEIASLIPFASIMIMPARMILIDVPVWQLAAAIVINIATLACMVMLSGRIYRASVLATGVKLSPKRIWQLMTAK